MRFCKCRGVGWVLGLALLLPVWLPAQTPDQAQELQARGDWKGAEQVWRQVLQQNAGDYRVWASLGIVLSKELRYQDAVAAYRKALSLHPGDSQTEMNLGIAYFKMGRLAEAVKPLEAAKAQGNSTQLDILLGISLYGAGRYHDATPYLERASLAEPGNAELQRTLGESYLQSGQYDQAMSAFKKVLIEHPESAQAHMLLGEAYDASNREEAAIAEFRSATQGTYLPNAYFGLGYLLWKAHRYDEAAAEFQKEMDHDPRNSQAIAYLGDIALKRGDKAGAEELLRRSIALRADNHMALVNLGIIETDGKQYHLAEEHLKRAVSLNTNEAKGHYRLGRLYQLTGRKVEAAREFARVKQVQQNDTDDMVYKVGGGKMQPQ